MSLTRNGQAWQRRPRALTPGETKPPPPPRCPRAQPQGGLASERWLLSAGCSRCSRKDMGWRVGTEQGGTLGDVQPTGRVRRGAGMATKMRTKMMPKNDTAVDQDSLQPETMGYCPCTASGKAQPPWEAGTGDPRGSPPAPGHGAGRQQSQPDSSSSLPCAPRPGFTAGLTLMRSLIATFCSFRARSFSRLFGIIKPVITMLP